MRQAMFVPRFSSSCSGSVRQSADFALPGLRDADQYRIQIELGKGKVEADVVRLAAGRLFQGQCPGEGVAGELARGIRQFPMAALPGQRAGKLQRDIGAGLGIEDLQQIAQPLRLDLERRLDAVEGQGVDERALEIDGGGGVRDREADAIGMRGIPQGIEGFAFGGQLAALIVIGARRR